MYLLKKFQINQNNQLIKSIQGDYNFYTQTGLDSTTQSELLRSNQPIDYISTVNIF
jgi:hypothetical protein